MNNRSAKAPRLCLFMLYLTTWMIFFMSFFSLLFFHFITGFCQVLVCTFTIYDTAVQVKIKLFMVIVIKLTHARVYSPSRLLRDW